MEEEKSNNFQKPMESAKQAAYFPPKNKNTDKQKYIKIAAVFIAVFLVVFFGLKLLKGKDKEEEKKETALITREPTSTPTPTPEIERMDLNIKVLNGSGKEGAAGAFASLMEDLGYEKPDADNADNYDYKDITIKVKDTPKGERIYDLLKEDLEAEDYLINDMEILDEDSEYDAVIIVGLKEGEEEPTPEAEEPTPEAEEPTPEETPTPTPTEAESTQSAETE